MQRVTVVTVFASLLMVLCGCEEKFIERQADGFVPNVPHEGPGGYVPSPGGQPFPTIIKQTFIPSYDLFAHTKCHTWRIEWPNYPGNMDQNKIPTVFSLWSGALNSFDYLNGQPAATTYKTHFNLYHNAQLERSSELWDELTHTFGHGDQMEYTSFNKVNISVKGLENMVKNRPGLFESYWTGSTEEPGVYQQGDVFLFRLMTLTGHSHYGGIRVVSMTPRIIEVYLAVPNN